MEIGAEVHETTPGDDIDVAVGLSWRLVIPGIAVGFLLAVLTIVWSDASNVAVAPDSPALSQVPDASISTSPLQPTQIVSIAAEPTPAVQPASPTPNANALFALSKVPPIRPRTLRTVPVQSAVFPVFNIVLHIPNGAQRSDATTLLGAAVGAGFEIADIQPAGFTISRTNVRYFHAKDAQAARALAGAIGGQLRDFTSFKPPPDPGVIEIWLKGEGTPARTD